MEPTDDDLLSVLAPTFARQVTTLRRTPYEYATSHALEELQVDFDNGDTITLLFKDLAWGRFLSEATVGKPSSLHDPSREIRCYRELLAGTGIGPRCHLAVDGPTHHWLFLEKVTGIELWQVGESDTWDAVAVWLARFHDRFDAESARRRNPSVLERSGRDLAHWSDRASRALVDSPDARAPELQEMLRHNAWRNDPEPPAAFLHGELYPSNVLVGTGAQRGRICPIDWEMAATGPRAFDIAALVAGWDPETQQRIIDRYRDAMADPSAAGDLLREVDRARFHLALQWIGWASLWQAPEEHAHDWIGEALEAGATLGR